jgi:DNA-binding SARP family transcriptional activator
MLANAPETRIQLCGRFVVRLAGRRVEDALPGRQGRMLLAYLTVHRDRTVTREELADALWWREPPSAPGVALSALLSKLRATLGGDVLPGKSELRIALPPDAVVDLDAAVEAVHRAETAFAAGDWTRAYGPAHVALYITERGFLPGLDAPWIDDMRRDVEDIRLRALECVVALELELAGGELTTAEHKARELTRLAPFRESGYCLLMRALEQRGNVAEALLVFDRLRCLLRDELGIAPGPGVQALHVRLLRQAAGVAPTA